MGGNGNTQITHISKHIHLPEKAGCQGMTDEGSHRMQRAWEASDDPRVRFRILGPSALSNAELLCIVLQPGNPDPQSLGLCRSLLSHSKESLAELGRRSVTDLSKISGMGWARALAVAAALELGRRRMAAACLPRQQVNGSGDIGQYLQARFRDLSQEVFAVVYLNQGNRILHVEVISSGGITATIVDIRLIMKKALEEEATGIILCHNHPSDRLEPSQTDKELTQKVREAARFFDIRLLDHIIVGNEGFYSFADNAML